MAKDKSKKQFGKPTTALKSSSWSFPLTPYNYKILGVGALIIMIAYGLMSTAISDDSTAWNNTLSVTIAPILLAIGYCVIIPYGLLARPKASDKSMNAEL